jgi:hypothetical protein
MKKGNNMLTIVAIALGVGITKLAATAAEAMCEKHKSSELAEQGKTISTIRVVHDQNKNVLSDMHAAAVDAAVTVRIKKSTDVEELKRVASKCASETYDFLNGVIE